MIRVAVSGCAGRMGKTVVDAVGAADDMDVVCGIDPHGADAPFPVYASVAEAVDRAEFDVLVDFTQPDVVAGNLAVCLPAGIDCVVGTTGLSNDTLEQLSATAENGACLFYAPNFTTGAVLMMQFAKAAAPYFPEAEVIEFHHAKKKDAPSGTAVRTAQIIAEARAFESSAPGAETEIEGCEGARGALVDGVPVHSVRSMGYVASQEVVFGSMGQSLAIRHDSWDRTSYMPGVLLGIRSVGEQQGLIVGLENFMA
ncbi:4-hydroxy-tetrahydrodipicolinate reductase [Raoultibacter timonensis]|uniref:4-hydroxy-tetrahydrodipicolinate reductase n=1 Tax=Raoultibacter timonensis TaxID=1907662 RepID=A0ABN6MGR4_9ACTN|nr:4-hydroxy-tetrahydrodipicolinate reductase [Raoultibacter timonensis]BDE96398.1 4-hydroxy-tetrahydrodipicolinate reductase [Raoultibacter timonensis]BDF51002.1 4-hydroxy-tetrahydrodipicolinate reductase [Raoultibacter timonensis]